MVRFRLFCKHVYKICSNINILITQIFIAACKWSCFNCSKVTYKCKRCSLRQNEYCTSALKGFLSKLWSIDGRNLHNTRCWYFQAHVFQSMPFTAVSLSSKKCSRGFQPLRKLKHFSKMANMNFFSCHFRSVTVQIKISLISCVTSLCYKGLAWQ